MKLRALPHVLCVILLLGMSFLSVMSLWVLPAQAAISSEQQTKTHHVQTVPTKQEILTRARIWTSSRVSYDRNPPYDGPNGYRKDCSGMVSMAWGLSNNPNGGLDTTGLATVSHQISKEELQPGDILLNTQADAHAVLFGGWIDANGNITKTPTDRYDALEENGDYQDGYGYAVEHIIPFPYYSGYYPEDYVPMRLNSLSSVTLPPTPIPPTPIPPTPIPPTTVSSPSPSTVLPGGMWTDPSPKNGERVSDIIHFAAHAYPTHSGDPAIAHVNFTVGSQGTWKVACTASSPATGDVFSCDANLKDLGVPYGQIQVSFDVYDQAGNVNYAPNGEHTVSYVPTPVPTPVLPTPVPSTSPSPVPIPSPSTTPIPVPSVLAVSPTNLYPGVCSASGDAYLCTITITETSDSQGSLHWQASADGTPFSPGSGTLSPGQSVQASLAFDCHSHTITVTGPGNTVTGHWGCQRIQVSPTSMNSTSPNCQLITSVYQCVVTLSETADSPGPVSWTVTSNMNVQYSPASGTLLPGNSVQVTILFIPCQSGYIEFQGLPASESIATINWSCP